jgi:2-iminobutanoate/2-iminopropanoate deaminase
MSKEFISTKNAPSAIGPYSQAVVANGMVYTSGQISIDPKTNEFVAGTVEEQTHQVCKNLDAVLKAANSSIGEVIKATIFVKDLGNFAIVNEIYGSYFTTKPARSTVEVSELPKGALVEIDCVALVK